MSQITEKEYIAITEAAGPRSNKVAMVVAELGIDIVREVPADPAAEPVTDPAPSTEEQSEG